MPDQETRSGGLHQVLLSLTEGDTLLSDLSKKSSVSEAEIVALLTTFLPLGVVKLGGGRITVPSVAAIYFLRSYAQLLLSGAVLVDDWYRSGAECDDPDGLLERGVCLLGAIERRRSSWHGQEPLRAVSVVKAIIKAVRDDDALVFLMLLNEKSHRLQFVGGTVRPGEELDLALRREILEEIPSPHLRFPQDYKMEKFLESSVAEQFVSPSTGVYTEYQVQYYFLTLARSLPLSGSLRWVSLSELLAGTTEDGVETVPPPDAIRRLENDLWACSLSTKDKPRYLPVSRETFSSAVAARDESKAAVFLGSGSSSIDHMRCFVIMPYSQDWSSEVEDIIRNACSEAGLTFTIAKNMDGRFVPHDIWAGITGSGITIADLSGANANVAYEVGLADAIGRQVVLISQTERVPFDFHGQRLLLYENSLAGSKKLRVSLKQVLSAYSTQLPKTHRSALA